MRTCTAVFAALVLGTRANAQAPAPDPLAGRWQGTLAAGATRLRIGLELARDSAGAWRATLVSIDQGMTRIESTATSRGDTLDVEAPRIHANFHAHLTAGRDSLVGTFGQGPATAPLALARVTTLGSARPQEPAPPFPYRTEEVTVASAAGVRLAGTLIVPAGAGPFPAVTFVTGSGPEDRDERTPSGHRPFLVLADYLARRGVVSLRVDDRGVGGSTGSYAAATSADFADDAAAAVRFLRARPEVAPNGVGIIGHSAGGTIAAMVASRSRETAFVVLLAASGVPGDSLLALQAQALLATAQLDRASLARTLAYERAARAVARSPADSATVVARVAALTAAYLAALPADARGPATLAAAQQVGLFATSWVREFLRYDPRPTLRRVAVPVLALGGSLDRQVPARVNLAAIDTALRAGGNRDVQVVTLLGLNHLFQTARTGGPEEYAAIEETFAPAALAAVGDWITARVGRGGTAAARTAR